MRLWKFNKRSSTLADMSMNRMLLTELIAKGALVGVIAGFCGATYRYLILESEHIRWHLMDGITMEWAIGWLVAMVIFAFIVDRLLAWAPLSGGSGIPQIEGEMLGLFDMKPYRTLASKMIGGVLTGFAGFSVGREGPAVQIGGSAGKIVSYWMNSGLREQRILTSAGAGAGLTAAFSAPVSGAMFVFEEVHKSFYPYLVIPTFVATLISNYITVSIFGLEPALGFSVTSGVPLEYFPVLLMVGVIMGLCGVLFCRMIFAFKKFFEWLKCSRFLKLALTFVTVAVIGYDSQLLLGGGNDLVGQLAFQSHGVLLLGGIVSGKILLTTFCYGSGAQGGIFLPMLVIGASAGAFCEAVLSSIGIISPDFVPQFVICAMGGMLAAAMRTPILAILLVLEMTKKEPPIYDSLLQAMSGQSNLEAVQTFFQTKVPVVANYTDVQLQDLALPEGTLIVSIRRNGTYIVPLGDVKLEPGDELQVSCERGRLKAAKEFFQSNQL
ncbi:MAG: chloride channel protein [Veillonella sp.]|nr:chloride channel protein [Veillonella sp.]